MNYTCPLIAVRDMERSKRFYRDVLGCGVVNDFGANVTLTGGFALQTLETWKDFIRRDAGGITFGGGAFYAPDRHIIEVGETMTSVVRRFIDSGLSAGQTAERTDVPEDYVRSCLEE